MGERGSNTMANYTGEFQGTLHIAGQLDAEGVYLFLTEDTLVLSKAGSHVRKTRITLFPVNMHMLLADTVSKVKSGFFFAVQGTRVGGISVGPLGHPADNEIDYRPMTSFRVEVEHCPEHLAVEISGVTGPGTGGMDERKVLEPWDFRARFQIPVERLQELFQLSDYRYAHFVGLLRQALGPA